MLLLNFFKGSKTAHAEHTHKNRIKGTHIKLWQLNIMPEGSVDEHYQWLHDKMISQSDAAYPADEWSPT